MTPWVLIGSVSAFLGVAMGAFGAHALSESLDPKSLAIYQTAAQYQMYHSLALVGLGIWSAQHPASSSAPAGWAFTLGIVLFSGSLYALALSGIKIFGAITPLGGLGFLIGWIVFAFLAWKA
jgi:uncharacterized membrane protein YgdD (TMEM256/DUF423 family)